MFSTPRRQPSNRFRWVLAVAILSTACPLAAEDPARLAVIRFQVTDAGGQRLPCRIHVKDQQGRPQQAIGQPFWKDHFVCDGRAQVNVTPGQYSWEIERGPEYEPQSSTVSVAAGSTKTVEVKLLRIADLRNDGWYSGDLHVHRPVQDIKLLMQAEDLDFAPVITWWNSRNQWRGQAIPDQTVIEFDEHRAYTVMAGEDEREGGALLYFGLTRPLVLPDGRKSSEYPSPMTFVDQAHQRNKHVWIDIEKPFWWDVPLWLASGEMDSIGIANNHMCRSRMLANEAWGRPRDVGRLPDPIGNGLWTQEIYYHALNCGLRIPPSAGSASGVLPNPVGYNRVYVFLNRDETPSEGELFTRFFAALRAGRCFVTNGPLLRVTANAQQAGAVLNMKDDKALNVQINADLTTKDDVSTLEVIHNGRVVATIPCEKQTNQKLSATVGLDQPGWMLVRAIASVDHTFRFASTAPWYIESESIKLPISKPSAQFFRDWVLERIDRVKRNVKDENQRDNVLETHQQALQFWTQRLQNATADLGVTESPVDATSR